MSNKNRIAIVLTSHADLGGTGKKTGYYLPEASHAYEVFARAGFEVTFVSPKGGAAPLDPGGQDRKDDANAKFLDDAIVQHGVHHTYRPAELNATELAAVFFAGGHGTMWDLRDDRGVVKLVEDVYRSGGVVSAVCHGPAALVDAKIDGKPLVADHALTAFSDAEEEAVGLTKVVPFLLERALVEKGAKYSKADKPFGAHVVTSGRLVTGQNPASTKGVAEAVVKILR